jgi:hypothetical protein
MAHNLGYLSPHADIEQAYIAAGPTNSKDIAIPVHASHAMTIIDPVYKLHFFLGIHNSDITCCCPKREEIRFGFATPINTVDCPV